jgi:hypothetical protein
MNSANLRLQISCGVVKREKLVKTPINLNLWLWLWFVKIWFRLPLPNVKCDRRDFVLLFYMSPVRATTCYSNLKFYGYTSIETKVIWNNTYPLCKYIYIYVVLANSTKREATSFQMCRVIIYLLLLLSLNLLFPGALSLTLINIGQIRWNFLEPPHLENMTQNVSFWYKTGSKNIHIDSLRTHRLSHCTLQRNGTGFATLKMQLVQKRSTNATLSVVR